MSDTFNKINDWFKIGGVEQHCFGDAAQEISETADSALIEHSLAMVSQSLKNLKAVTEKNPKLLSIAIFSEELAELFDGYLAGDGLEVRDAVVDSQWTLIGLAYAMGFPMQRDLERLIDSNYSKFPITEQEAKDTVIFYLEKKDIEAEYIQIKEELFVVKNKKTGKILKSINYTPMFGKF